MTERQELLDATDETIDDAVKYADPMVLRGLLYQLTGDESVAATPVRSRVLGLVEAMVLVNASDAAMLQSKAADFLKSYRNSGAEDIRSRTGAGAGPGRAPRGTRPTRCRRRPRCSDPPATSTSPFGSVVLVGYQRPAFMSGIRVQVSVSGS
jgi:hypothetical protein